MVSRVDKYFWRMLQIAWFAVWTQKVLLEDASNRNGLPLLGLSEG
jgi:hypothetical protein